MKAITSTKQVITTIADDQKTTIPNNQTQQQQQQCVPPASVVAPSPTNQTQPKPSQDLTSLRAKQHGKLQPPLYRYSTGLGGHYQIFLQPPGNQPCCLIEVATTWTISDLKSKIQDIYGASMDQVRLVHAGNEFTGTQRTLGMCGVNEFTTVQCLFRLPGGAKAKSKGGKSFKKGKKTEQKTELMFKEPNQEYAQVTSLLGSSRLRVRCADGTEMLCTIRGKLVRRAWVNVGSIILVSLRDFEQGKCDMIHRYSDDEARRLRAYDELPREMKLTSELNGDGCTESGEDGILFDFDADQPEVDIESI